MDFVTHLNLFGVEAKEIPSIVGEGAPTIHTMGDVGCLYMDSLTGEMYKCTSKNNSICIWETFVSQTALQFIATPYSSWMSYDVIKESLNTTTPYQNSWWLEYFSRTPLVGEIYSFVFIDKNYNKCFGVAQVISEPTQNSDGYWFSPFKMLDIMLLYDAKEISEMKKSIESIPTTLPHTVSYGVDYIEGIIGDTDALKLSAFTKIPKVNDIFFFIAVTRKKDVVGVTAKVIEVTTNQYGEEIVRFSVEDATLFHSTKEINDLKEKTNGLKFEEWKLTYEDGSTEIKKVAVYE